jgi:hypothetical protein
MMSQRTRRPRLVRDRRNRYPLPAITHGTEILWLLSTFRFATNDQIERVLFRDLLMPDRNVERAANTALRRLFDGGFLDRVPVLLPATAGTGFATRYVNTLTPAGARVVASLAAERGTDVRTWRASLRPKAHHPLLHEYWIVQFGLTALASCREVGISMAAWADDRQLAAWRKEDRFSLGNIPDAYLGLQNPRSGKQFPSFVEIDQGTETVAARSATRRDWRRKVEGYLPYFDRGFAQEFGIEAKPIVLTVTTSEARLGSLLETTRQAGGGGRFWFTAHELLYPKDNGSQAIMTAFAGREGPFWAPIWRTPADGGWRSLATRCGLSPSL